MQYILAHDLGTSGNKATLFGEDGRLVASTVFSYGTHYFNGTWAEQDPEDWWRAVCETSKALLASTGIAPQAVAAVSFSGQMMGCLCVDRAGTPLRPSIIWADQRAQAQTAALGAHIPLKDYYHAVGHRNSASYGLQKLMWVRDNQPEIYKKTWKALNAKDFIVFRLTGKMLTEPSDASGNACVNLRTFDWSQEILSCAGIGLDKFPEIVPSTHVAGGVTEEAARATGLVAGTPVVMGGGDGCCANVGAGSVRPGAAFSYVGSSSWIATTSAAPVFDEEMRTVTWAHLVPGLYAPNGTMQSAGGAYNWLKSQICLKETADAAARGISAYDLINAEVAQSPVGANGVVFLPYLLGERSPRWNSEATAAFLGLKMENERKDLLRSVLEGVTMNLAIILDVLRAHGAITELLVIGGGAKGAVWRQIMADVYGAKIKVPKLLEEATSMGAAVTGGVGVGLFKDFDAIDQFIEIDCVHEPDAKAHLAYQPIRETFELCYQSLLPLYAHMAQK
ncbi:MAG: FGGY-family carbohydrate kinase [Clostridia bacterium]